MTVINTNVKSLIAQASLAANNKNLSTAMERLSTGSRINSAKDDAAGLAISSRMTSQVRGLNVAVRNANDGISLAQTAEGAMEEVTSMLQRMRELSIQAGNSVNNASDRAALDAEVQQLKSEIDRIAGTTTFNGQNILDGSFSGRLQIGDQASQTMDIAIASLSTVNLGETDAGPAVGATKATLTIGGVSSNVGDYSGVNFNVAVNGVNKNVTLPSATPVNSVINTNFQVADRVETIAPQQVGAFKERLIDISSTANSGTAGKLNIAVNDGDVGTFTIDVKTAADNLGYDSSALAGDQFVVALQAAIDSSSYFTGDNAVTVSLDANNNVQFDVAGGIQKIAVSEINGTGTSLLDTLSGAGTTKLATGQPLSMKTLGSTPADADEVFGMQQFSIDSGTNDTLSIQVGSGQAVSLTLASADTLFDSMADLAAHIQTKINSSGSFNGDNAITVGAVRNADYEWGLTFSNAAAQKLTLSGTFMTAGSAVTSTINDVAVTTRVNKILPTGTSSLELTPQKQFGQFNELKFNASNVIAADASTTVTDSMQKFVLNVNGGGDAVINIGAALDAMALTETVTESALTQSQFVRALQTAIDDTGLFQGDNAVTVGVTAEGLVSLSVAGGVGSILVKEDSTTTVGAATTYDGLAKALIGTNSGVVGAASEQVSSGGYLALGSGFNAAANAGTIGDPGSINIEAAGGVVSANVAHFVLTDTQGNVTDVLTAAAGGTTIADLVTAMSNTLKSTAGTLTDSGGVASLYSVAANTAATGIVIKRSDGVDFTVALGTSSAQTVAFTPDGASATALIKGGLGASSKETVQTFGLAKTLIGAGDGGSKETVTTTLAGTWVAGETITFDNFTYNVTTATDGSVSNALRDDFVSKFNQATGTAWVASAGVADYSIVMTAKEVGNIDNTTQGLFAETSASGTVSDVVVAGSAATYNLENTLTLKVGDNSSIDINVATVDTSYSSMEGLRALVQNAIDQHSGLQGDNRVVVSVGTDSLTGKTGLTFSQAAGQSLAVSGSFITGELRETQSAPWVIETTRTGGIDLSSDNVISVTIANADNGSSFTKSIALGSSDSNVTLADYAALVQSGINSAFSAEGYSVTAAESGGAFSLSLDQTGAKTITLTGASVTASLGGAQTASGVGTNSLSTMTDVVREMNADMGGDAVVTFDADSGSLTFSVVTGEPGTSSSVAVSGAGLSTMQFAGVLDATGTAGNATASKLSDIAVLSIDSANAAINSIDNALQYVNSQRAYLGAIQNRLDHTVSNLTNIATNTEASRSRIMDADYGAESANLAKAQIIQQAATAMLAQANQSAQSVLSLLQ